MLRLTLLSAAILGCSLLNQARAQFAVPVLVPPATKLEAFETNIAVVIFKATTDLGSVSAKAGVVGVRCRETTDLSTGRKEQGIAIAITQKGQLKDTMLIDYDEIAPLLVALDYLSKLEATMTPLNTFDAAYTTKGGFRIAALGSRPAGAVQFGVRDARNGSIPIIFSGVEMSRFCGLIAQAKTTLDALRGG